MTPAMERLIPWLATGYVVVGTACSDHWSAELIAADIRNLDLGLSEEEIAELTERLQRPNALRGACIDWRMTVVSRHAGAK